MNSQPFWKTKTLTEMTKEEWESLCDGCGLCCLVKLENIDTGEILTTDIACKYLNLKTCRCSDYENRHKNVSDCIALTSKAVSTLNWLPETCAYRLVNEGNDLHSWHYLISQDKEAVHKMGISKKGTLVSESSMPNLADYVLESLNRDLRENAQDSLSENVSHRHTSLAITRKKNHETKDTRHCKERMRRGNSGTLSSEKSRSDQ